MYKSVLPVLILLYLISFSLNINFPLRNNKYVPIELFYKNNNKLKSDRRAVRKRRNNHPPSRKDADEDIKPNAAKMIKKRETPHSKRRP